MLLVMLYIVIKPRVLLDHLAAAHASSLSVRRGTALPRWWGTKQQQQQEGERRTATTNSPEVQGALAGRYTYIPMWLAIQATALYSTLEVQAVALVAAHRACPRCLGQGHLLEPSRRGGHSLQPCASCSVLGVVPGYPPAAGQWSALDVVVVGAGIGGAALCLALQQRGVRVSCAEKDADVGQRRQGYGLTMQQAALALARLGVQVQGCKSASHYSFLPDGKVLGCYGRGLYEAAGVQGPAPKRDDVLGAAQSHKVRNNTQLPRQRLRVELVRRLAPGVVLWGEKFVKYVEDKDGVTVYLDSGKDGIYSLVRKQKIGDELKELGVAVILGMAVCTHPLTHNRVTQTLDGCNRIYTMPFSSPSDDEEPFKGQSMTMWQLSFPMSSLGSEKLPVDQRGLKELAIRLVGKWHAPIPELIHNTKEEYITGYPALDRNALSKEELRGKYDSRVTLLGDAAHPMSPFKGQGANQALIDGLNLARKLYPMQHSTLFEALAEFEADMLARAGEKVALSRDAAAFLHSSAALKPGNCVRSLVETKANEQIRPSRVKLGEDDLKRAAEYAEALIRNG